MQTKFATGLATGAGTKSVADSALNQAQETLGEDRVDFCQVFISSTLDYRLALDRIRAKIGTDVPLIGCTSIGEFTNEGHVDQGIAIALIASDTIKFHTGIGTGLDESVSRAVRDSLSEIPETVEGYPYRSAIQLHDGLQGVSERLTLVTQRKLGPEAVFGGGAAADDFELESTPVFCDDKIAENAVAIATMDAKSRPAVSVNHGHTPVTEPLEVTSSTGSLVSEIDGKPALDVWREAIREPASELFDVDIDTLDPGSRRHQQLTGAFSFGINQGDDYKIRWFQIPNPSGTDIHFSVDIPEGVMLHVMESTKESQLSSARDAARVATGSMSSDYAGAFVYDCATREIILGDEFNKAVDTLDSELNAPFIGFETYGEVCMRMGDASGYHNTSTVVKLIPK